MKEVRYTSQARKDLKRYRHDAVKMPKLYHVLQLLANDEPLPEHFHPHLLKGNYVGCLECHVKNDFLLVWMDESTGYIEVIRVGTHLELFG